MELNFERIDTWNFSLLDRFYSGSGIYVMIFPDGKRYLGKSKHLNRRIREHFRDFSFASDWHSAAAHTFTQLQLPVVHMPDHSDWKRITQKRRLILEQEREECRKEYNEIRYRMACDFFKNVQLWIWEVPVDQITEAEDWCLNEITALGKRENYYNTVYPKPKEE